MGRSVNECPSVELFGLPVHALTMAQAVAAVDRAILSRRRLLIGVVNAAKLVGMRRDAELDASVRSADLVLADGMAVVWASRLLRRPLPERVPGIDLMKRILERGRETGYRIFCLGATADVLEEAVARMQADFPGIRIVGKAHGYFSTEQEAEVAGEIAAAKPDVLFVAMSSPKKERFLARWSHKLGVPVCHGVGGAFDVMAGKVKRAPDRWQRWGMEWLYRLLQEPRRMWRRYLVSNTLFCGMVLREMLLRNRRPRVTPQP